MDNIREENLKRLAKFIAEELINLGKETDRDNSDRIQPYFSSGQFTNKDEGGIKAQSSVE